MFTITLHGKRRLKDRPASPRLFARPAMGTRFEIAIEPSQPMAGAHLRACAEQALDEIAALDHRLSLFRRDSFLAFINRTARERAVSLDEDFFGLLSTCLDAHHASEGAFDITVAPLMRCWGFHAGECSLPTATEIDSARAGVGSDAVVLDSAARTIRFARDGLELDLGGIAKGFALDQASNLLREGGIKHALLHGGTSTVVALGAPQDREAWRVGVRDPTGGPQAVTARVDLRDAALAVSAPHGRRVPADTAHRPGHLIDPRTGRPAEHAALVAVIAPTATLADAWSTALLVAGPARFDALAGRAGFLHAALMVVAGETASHRLVTGPRAPLFTLADHGLPVSSARSRDSCHRAAAPRPACKQDQSEPNSRSRGDS